jgi:hypothetical protein
MDPFSILVGTAGITDICIRLIKYLRDVQAGAAAIDEDIDSLIQEIKVLTDVNKSIRTVFQKEMSASAPSPPHDCRKSVEKLQAVLESIYGEAGPKSSGVVDQFVKASKKRSKEKELRQCRDNLSTYYRVLQISLISANL